MHSNAVTPQRHRGTERNKPLVVSVPLWFETVFFDATRPVAGPAQSTEPVRSADHGDAKAASRRTETEKGPPGHHLDRLVAARSSRLVSESEAELQRKFTAMAQAAGVRTMDTPKPPQPQQPQPPAPQMPETPQRPQPEPPKPDEPKPDEPEKPKENPCKAIEDALNSILDDLFDVRPKFQETAGKIVAIEDEIKRMKSEPIDLPPIPGRMPRRPFRLRKQIPDAAKDIAQDLEHLLPPPAAFGERGAR